MSVPAATPTQTQEVVRSPHLSSPAQGRPLCFWHFGFNSELITEEWTDESAPLATAGRAACESDLERDQAEGRTLLRFTFTVAPRKVVVYHKGRPHLRVIEVRDELRDGRQVIKYRGIEVEGDFRLRDIVKAAQPLFDELFRVERRGAKKKKATEDRIALIKSLLAVGNTKYRIAKQIYPTSQNPYEALRKFCSRHGIVSPSHKTS